MAAAQSAGISTLEVETNAMRTVECVGLTVHDIAEAVRSGNSTKPAGYLTVKGKRLYGADHGDLEKRRGGEATTCSCSLTWAILTVGDLCGVEFKSKDRMRLPASMASACVRCNLQNS